MTDREQKIYKLQLLRRKKELEEQEIIKQDFPSFAEKYIKITNKKGQSVPLIQNFVQNEIHKEILELQSKGIPPRIIVLKSRQMGASTGIQGRMIKETTTKENRNGFIVSHEDDSTSAIFQKTKYMYDNLDDDVKPLQKASNAQELIFDKPLHYNGNKQGLHSKIEIKTAGNSGIGRSETRQYVHLSEFAFWRGKDSNSPRKQLSGIMQSVPDEIDTWVIIESTANGMNDFYDLCQDAIKGLNGFVFLFFPWYVHAEYEMLLNDWEKEHITETFGEYENWLYKELGLSFEKIKWWRETKRLKCNNDINQMKQENPTTPDEAFIFSGTPIFDIETVAQRKEVLKQKYAKQPPKRGYFLFKWNNPDDKDKILDESIQFVEDERGCIKIYEEPKKGYPYVFGGDTKGDGSDFFAGTGINNVTGKRICTLHGDMDPDEYTHQMYCLGKYYNYALMSIEINFDIYPVKELQRLKYHKQYRRVNVDSSHEDKQDKLGWKTDGNTRPLIISKEVSLIRDNIELFNDVEFLDECLTFVKDKNGRGDAMSGKHDDILMSDMIANQSRDQQTFEVKAEISKTPIDQLTGYYTEDELKDKGYTKFEIRQYLNKKIKPWGNR